MTTVKIYISLPHELTGDVDKDGNFYATQTTGETVTIEIETTGEVKTKTNLS